MAKVVKKQKKTQTITETTQHDIQMDKNNSVVEQAKKKASDAVDWTKKKTSDAVDYVKNKSGEPAFTVGDTTITKGHVAGGAAAALAAGAGALALRKNA